MVCNLFTILPQAMIRVTSHLVQHRVRCLSYEPGVQPKTRIVALVLHGGCFSQGDETWQAEQCKSWCEKQQWTCVTADFRQTCLIETFQDLHHLVQFVRGEFVLAHESPDSAPARLGVIGCSSGGYFALRCAQMTSLHLDFVVALCPVVDPHARYLYLSHPECPLLVERRKQMQTQQGQYFQGSLDKMKQAAQLLMRKSSYRCRTLCIFGESDTNVPLNLIQTFCQMAEHEPLVDVALLPGTHELCSRVSAEVTEKMSAFVDPPTQQSALTHMGQEESQREDDLLEAGAGGCDRGGCDSDIGDADFVGSKRRCT